MYMGKHLPYILVGAGIQKIHSESGMTTKQLIREVEQVTEHKRLTTKEKHPHGAEGVSKDKLTGKYCRGVFEATACVEKLAEYETAEEEGRLVVLPCKVGDILFCFSRVKIYPFKVRCIRIYEERVEIELWYAGDEENLKFWNITIAEQDIGYKFLFTHEEAEKALKEMEGK